MCYIIGEHLTGNKKILMLLIAHTQTILALFGVSGIVTVANNPGYGGDGCSQGKCVMPSPARGRYMGVL